MTDFGPFLDKVWIEDFAQQSTWFWMLFRQDLLWQEQTILFPAMPTTSPNDGCFPTQMVETSEVGKFTVNLRCASINVLTFRGHPKREGFDSVGFGGPARQEAVLRQLSEQAITLFALQETRLRQASPRHTDDFWLFGSPATPKGQYGIIVGFSRSAPFAWNQHEPLYFHEADFAIIATNPRFLILRVKTDALRVIIVAAHAPHTGADLEEINRFWQSLSAQIPSRYDDWARLLLADANARVGSITSDHVGPHQAETDTEKSEAFRNYLAEEDLWLPATFEDYQTGPGATWKSTSRNDFIGIFQDNGTLASVTPGSSRTSM